MSEAICYKCQSPIDIKVGHKAHRSDVCDHCNTSIKCCKNCTHYLPSAYNECKENQAERVLEKEKANFCEFFTMRNSSLSNQESQIKLDQKAKLAALFK